MNRLGIFLSIFSAGSAHDRLADVNIFEDNGYGKFWLDINGDFENVEKLEVTLVNGDTAADCKVNSVSQSLK